MNAGRLIVNFSMIISLVSCTEKGESLSSNDVELLPTNFSHQCYWENHIPVQERCTRNDVECINLHWDEIGRAYNLSYACSEEFSSANTLAQGTSSNIINQVSSAEFIYPSSMTQKPYSSQAVANSSWFLPFSRPEDTIADPTSSLPSGTYDKIILVQVLSENGRTHCSFDDTNISAVTPICRSRWVRIKKSSTLHARAFEYLGGLINKASRLVTFNYTINIGNPCSIGSTMIDSRDNQEYNITKIGDQCWMTENLNYETSSGSYCEQEGCELYGRYYDWEVAMKGSQANNDSPSGVQGVCPNGWHIPSQKEWEKLKDFVGGDARLLKSPYAWLYVRDNLDTYDFAALGGGYWNGSYAFLRECLANWISTTNYDENKFISMQLGHAGDDLSLVGVEKEGASYNIRCVKD